MSISRLYKETFFTSSSWKCPAGVKFIILTGCGGGGGGGGGAAIGSSYGNAISGMGGEPALTTYQVIPVNPGINYSITIGAGGLGGNANYGNISFANGSPGISGIKGDTSHFDIFFTDLQFVGGNGGIGGIPIHNTTDPFLKNYLLMTRHLGGISNNIYSYGGYPGVETNVIGSYGGGGGTGGIGGGGGGGGFGGRIGPPDGDGGVGGGGGNGGSGFIEIAWIQ